MSKTKTRAAFFDIDGTLLNGFIICAFPDYLVKNNAFSNKLSSEIWSMLADYGRGETSASYIARELPKKYALGLKGKAESQICALAKSFMIEYINKKSYSFSESLVKLMKNHGFLTFAISGSPIECIRQLAGWGFVEMYGTELGSIDGIYTGKLKLNLIDCGVRNKVFAELVQRYRVDLSASYGFGDTIQDLPLLTRVGHPVVLNPDPILEEYATKEGWLSPDNDKVISAVSHSITLNNSFTRP